MHCSKMAGFWYAFCYISLAAILQEAQEKVTFSSTNNKNTLLKGYFLLNSIYLCI